MATRSSSQKRTKVPCGVCQGPVTDGKDEALLCEGQCGQWLHRGCASIPPSRYKELSTSSEPFVCLICSNLSLRQQIADLMKELKDSLETRSMVTKLEAEVSSLRTAVEKLSREGVKQGSQPKRLYAAAVRRPHRQNAVTGRSRTSRTSQPQAEAGTASTADEPLPAADHHQACAELQREPVSGVRRVWGTLRSATIYVVKNTICTVSSLSSVKEMHVKRKTQPGRSGKDRWWFLLHGKENDLKSLEDMWERIKLQTGWKLEVCTRPVKSQPPSPAENASHADETASVSVTTSANPTTTTCPHTPASTSKATPQSPTICTDIETASHTPENASFLETTPAVKSPPPV